MPLNLCDKEGHRKYLTAAEDACTPVWTRAGEVTTAAFGLNATVNSVPLNKVEQWLGSADLRNTPIYGDATCAEEDWIAERMRGVDG